jgi:hypothetical protein
MKLVTLLNKIFEKAYNDGLNPHEIVLPNSFKKELHENLFKSACSVNVPSIDVYEGSYATVLVRYSKNKFMVKFK